MRDQMIFFMDLVPSASKKDSLGDPAMQEQISEMVFAEIKSISQSEFYQAQTAGNKPEIKFVITDNVDYQGQKYIIHDGVRYKVLRTYRKNSNELEITCYGGVRNANTTISDKDHQRRR